VRFCSWYPLAEAGAHAPAAEGVLQLRLAHGLREYPHGKSAMVHYAHAADVRAAAIALAAHHADRALLCRHLELVGERVGADAAAEASEAYARVLRDFIRRFGAAPTWSS
jgi:hypothetical protein